jgi:DNA-binding NarL/FixJ family response regulator
MIKSDFSRFASAIAAVMDLYDKPISEAAAMLWWTALEQYPIDQVERAITAHTRDPERGRYAPRPADLIAAMADHAENPWPSPDEAWAIALTASDERASVVWCDEIAQALGAAQSVLSMGDEVGARMAFRDAYRRLTRQTQDSGRQPRWWVTQGHDPQQRAQAVIDAQARGLLQHDRAQELLARITGTAPSRDQGPVMAQITGNVVDFPVGKQRLAALKRMLEPQAEAPPSAEKLAEIERKKAAAAAMLQSSKQA